MNQNSSVRALLCLGAAFLLTAAPLAAQQVSGKINGSVTEATGSFITGANVKIVSEATGQTRETKSGNDGTFEVTNLQPGKYRIEITQTGFKRLEHGGIELTANQSLSVGQLKLTIGDVATSLTVQAEVTQLQTSSGERSGIISSDEIRDLTVINRDFVSLVSLLPGVVDTPGTAEVQGFSGNASVNVNGGRSNGNSITIDGGSTENTNGGNGNNFVSLDSIGSVRIITSNYQPEFGRKPAASIMAISKGGSQKYHGAAYWYYRHEWMNANQFFNNRQGLPQTPRRVQTPGFNIGGPVPLPGRMNNGKMKVFFFGSLEFIKERRPLGIINLTTPTAAERTGDFSNSKNGTTPVYIKDPTVSGTCSASNRTSCFPNNIIPPSRIDKNGQALLNVLPLPNVDNSAVANGAYNFSTQESLNIPKVLFNERVDFIVDEKTSFWLKYNFWREDQQGWAVSAGNSNWGYMPAHYISKTHAPAATFTRIVNPTTVLEASVRVTRWTEDGAALDTDRLKTISRASAGFKIPQLYPGGNPLNLLPNTTFGGVPSAIGTSLNARFPLRGAESPGFADLTITKTKGPHTAKFGFYYERWKAVKGESGVWNGTYDFTVDANNPNDSQSPFANALQGNFKTYKESNNRPPLYEQSFSYEWYAQDSWKVKRNFTLDYGIRFGWSTPFYSSRRQEAGFVPNTWNPAQAVRFISPVRVNNVRLGQDPVTKQTYPAILIGAIAPGSGDPFNGTVNLMTNSTYPHGLRENSGVKAAPRIGFAWDPFNDNKTVIRGGIGLFYEIHEKDLWGYALHLDPPNQLTPQISYGSFESLAASQGYQFPSATSGLNPKRTLGRTYSYSFGVQRQLGKGFMIDVAYVATLGRHLLERKDLNAIPIGTTLNPANLDTTNNNAALPNQFLYPYPGYTNIFFYNYDSNSSYHSAQTMLNKRLTHGLSGGLAWTWSKAMDYGDLDTVTLSNLISPKVWNYGEAGYDRTHILKGSWVYSIPKASQLLPNAARNIATRGLFDGWQMSGIMTLMSGAPQGVSLGTQSGNANNVSGSPTDAARPMMVGVPTLPKDQKTFSLNVNPAAFAMPAVGTLGNAPKNVYRGPGRNNFDISMFKNFRVTERFKAQFRAEAYNIFNHTQYTSVDNSIRFNNTAGVVKGTLNGVAYSADPGAQVPTTFGQFTAAGLSRRMQLGLRVDF
jgi:hypothetical protein